jgi:hypothetical protein
MINNHPNCDDDDVPRGQPIDPSIVAQSQRCFTSIRLDTYRCVRPTERDLLTIPWGPKVDVLVDPRGAAGVLGGTVRLVARTAGTEIELASATIIDPEAPVLLSGGCGCDEYVVKARLGTDPGALVKRIESYVFARVYSGL